MASGFVGTNIKSEVNIFVSANAGVSWNQILHGEYLYSFADHGGLLVAATQFNTTDHIYYSTDEGMTWKQKKIADSPIRVYGILTEPGEKTTVFSVFGSKLGHHSWLITQVNLSSVLGKKCSDEAYKWWSFTMTNDTKGCLLGRHTLYRRKIKEAVCYNGEDFVREKRNENCPCTRLDYECDFGFMLRNFSYECIFDPHVNKSLIHTVPNPCPAATYYPYTRGYRKVAGDTCMGGADHRFAPLMYSCPIQERHEFVLFTTRRNISILNIDTNEYETIVSEDLDHVTAVEFNYRNNCVYWADINQDRIKRLCFGSHEDDEVENIVVKDLHTVESLVYDWTADTLYWVDSEAHSISVVRSDGHFRRTLFKNETLLDRPRALALDPHHGYMYWTDWSYTHPRIGRAWMDGTNSSVEIIVSNSYVRWPNGLAIDLVAEKLYWTDAGNHKIMTSDLNGANVRTLLSGSFQVPHPYSLGIYKNSIYWTDWSKETLMVADKKTGNGMRSLPGRHPDIADMKVVSHTSQTATSACSHNTCSQLCLPKASNGVSKFNRTCKCGDGVPHSKNLTTGDEHCQCNKGEISRDGHCMSANRSTCATGRFSCHNGRCIPETWLCDTDNDCGDHSDEIDCPYETCPSNTFHCTNGRCIPMLWKCDYDNDCGDRSDELGCQQVNCTADQFRCANNRCIAKTWQCDLDDDCHDGSDERNCNDTVHCRSWEFHCGDGQCVSSGRRCDGSRDCHNGEDEFHCNSTRCEYPKVPCDEDDHQCIFPNWRCDGESDCNDGSDEKNCSSTPSYMTSPSMTTSGICHHWQFRCHNSFCIYIGSRCDGANDCGDNSDEINCGGDLSTTTTSQRPCPASHFMCYSGQCISSDLRCNGHNDCDDNSDESYCARTCGENHFLCYNTHPQQCIWDSWVCDGENDCFNAEDEKFCNATSCGPSDFRCLFSEGCVPLQRVCDGHHDCSDLSDEMGCNTTTVSPVSYTTPSSHCEPHEFDCPMEGTCIDYFFVCDGHADCMSREDETLPMCYENKTVETTAVAGSETITVRWQAPDSGGPYSYIVSCIEVWGGPARNVTLSTPIYVVKHLHAGVRYHVAVYVKEGSKVYPHSAALMVTTLEGVPSTPTHFSAHLWKGEVLQVVVKWSKPSKYAESVSHYNIYYQDVKSGNPVIVSLPTDVWKRDFRHSLTPSQLDTGKHYKIWMSAVGSSGESDYTRKVDITFIYQGNTAPVVTSKVGTQSITLTWKKIPNASYRAVLNFQEEGLETVMETNDTHVTFNRLCPHTTYSYYVQAVLKSGPSYPSQTTQVNTKGSGPILPPQHFNITKIAATSVQIRFWGDEVKKAHIVYYHPHSPLSKEEFLTMAMNVSIPPKSSQIITGLLACERYFFLVGASPVGCPLTPSRSIETDPDNKAPPKNIEYAVSDDKGSVKVYLQWDAPCDYSVVPVGYIIETSAPDEKTNAISVSVSGNITNFHWLVNLKYEKTYSIRIRTTEPGAFYSKPIHITLAFMYPPVVDLFAEHIGQGRVYLHWREPDHDIPEVSADGKVYFKVVVKRSGDNSFKMTNVTDTTEIYYQLEMEYDYIFTVSYDKVKNHYGSPVSVTCPVFKSQIGGPSGTTLSTTNLVSILVPVGIVIVILVVVLSIFIYRHRRLQRSFLAFANSHYDPRSGTTTFTAADDLGDDEDTPMIQGFSDDVPLVIA